MSRTLKPSRDDTSKVACVILVVISWGMVVANVMINIRDGQRLSVDDYCWLMNGFIVGMLSVAPTATMGFAAVWRRGRWGWAIVAADPPDKEICSLQSQPMSIILTPA